MKILIGIIVLAQTLLIQVPIMDVHVERLEMMQEENLGDVSPTADTTTWYYRVSNGILQKRLWSITEAKWLTDWIDCE